MSYLTENILRKLEEFIASDSKEERTQRGKDGEFHYIPLSLKRFEIQLKSALAVYGKRPEQTLHFVDVGCGIGTKLIAASDYSFRGLKLSGVEKNARYVGIARKLLESAEVKAEIIQCDALTHDYAPYDLIYFYCPLCDPKKQAELEVRILTTAHKGALILPNLAKLSEPSWKKHTKCVFNPDSSSGGRVFRVNRTNP